MAWVSYRSTEPDGARTDHVGIVDGADYVPLAGVSSINAGRAALAAARPDENGRIPAREVQLLPASPAPAKVLCVGLNYRDHITETGRDTPSYPVLFPKYASSLIAADAPITVPPESDQVDYEGELAVVIGTAGRRIHPERAMEHVLGYTVANDVTMRDFQYLTHQWVQGKAWDACTPLGPAIVPWQQVTPAGAAIVTEVDGEQMQRSTLDQLLFDVPTLVAQVSVFTQLLPGDVILTGTPGGVGFRRTPPLFLTPGRKVSVRIDGVGRIDSVVAPE